MLGVGGGVGEGGGGRGVTSSAMWRKHAGNHIHFH